MNRRALLVIAALGAAALVPMIPATAAGASTLVVPRDFPTVQSAIDAAAPGAQITVRPGTYTEEIVISKDITLRGAGQDKTVIKAPDNLTTYGVHLPDGRDLTAIVRVDHHAKVAMSGLTVRGPIPCGKEVSGINVLGAATLDLSDSRVTDIHVNPESCAAEDAAGRAVVYGIPPHIIAEGRRGGTAYGQISNVVVDRYQHAGISVAGPDDGRLSRVEVRDNTVIGGAVLPSFQIGIHVAAGAIAHVTGNLVTRNVCHASYCGPDPLSQGQGIGIELQSALAASTIANNTLVANDVGVYQVDSTNCCKITGNTFVSNRDFGILFQDGDGAAGQNIISGGRIGIGVAADFVDTTATLRGNRISATSVAAVRTFDCCGYTATAVVT